MNHPKEDDIQHAYKQRFTVPDTPAYQEVTENYTKPKLFVATPCYAGTVHVKYMESMLALSHSLTASGIGFEFYNIPFDSLIPRARNASITRFMTSSECTHIIFIDADIQFHPSSVIKMLREDKDVIAGCYPKKSLDFDQIAANHGKTKSQLELIQSAVKYAYNFKPQRSHKLDRGCVEVLDAPTGFMMIKKQVIRNMMKYYPEMEYINDVGAYQSSPNDRFFDLFQSQVVQRRYLSEDYGFCRLWQHMGGTIYADLTVKLNHIGQFCYFGDPLTHLRFSNHVEFSSSNPSANVDANPTEEKEELPAPNETDNEPSCNA